MKKILISIMVLISIPLISTNSISAAALLQNSDKTEYSAISDSTKAGSNNNCIDDGSCGVNDFIKVGLRVTEIILGLVGSISLLMFVYGGVMFLISGGSSERVEKGKQIIIGSIVGLIIVFASYTIIGFIFSTLGIDAGWASSGWFNK
ncbi:MAG: hypothetical protein AAB906_02670 [Patescibacteria group bacterium]